MKNIIITRYESNKDYNCLLLTRRSLPLLEQAKVLESVSLADFPNIKEDIDRAEVIMFQSSKHYMTLKNKYSGEIGIPKVAESKETADILVREEMKFYVDLKEMNFKK